MRRLDRAHDADEFSLVRRLRRLRPLERAGWLVETLAFEPRPDCVAKLEAQGLASHDHDHYGREDACDRFSAAEIEAIEAAMRTLHLIGLHALNVATATGRLAQLGVPQAFSLPIGASPARGEFSLAGRLDRAYNGRSAPKPLEYNSDTPTSLLESAVCLRYWLKDRFPEHDPCNSLRERPVECWKALPGRGAWRRC